MASKRSARKDEVAAGAEDVWRRDRRKAQAAILVAPSLELPQHE